MFKFMFYKNHSGYHVENKLDRHIRGLEGCSRGELRRGSQHAENGQIQNKLSFKGGE